jgi:hypothetical protein
LGILPKEPLFLVATSFIFYIKGEGDFNFLFYFIFVASCMTYNYAKGRALCTAKGMHMFKQQLVAEFASGVSNNDAQ